MQDNSLSYINKKEQSTYTPMSIIKQAATRSTQAKYCHLQIVDWETSRDVTNQKCVQISMDATKDGLQVNCSWTFDVRLPIVVSL